VACPACGGRLVTKTHDRPPRLICSNCGRVLPESTPTPLLVLLERHWVGLLVLLGLILVPGLLMTLGPWAEQRPHRTQRRLGDTPVHRRIELMPVHRQQRN
jgi:hypothetical protein